MLKYDSRRKACRIITAMADFCWHPDSILEGLSDIELKEELDAAGFKLYRKDNRVSLYFNNEETKS